MNSLASTLRLPTLSSWRGVSRPRKTGSAVEKTAIGTCHSLGCGSHGTCNSESGQCECEKSYTGAQCDTKRCADNCNGVGTCFTGSCVCGRHHFGTSCQHKRCPEDCSGHGYCFNARCLCTGTYGGENCLLQVHSDNVVRFNLTKQRPLLSGPPLKVSSLRASAVSSETGGDLSTLQTVSRFDAKLDAEQEQQCPKSCSNRGHCIKGNCLCYAGFQGSDCSVVGACSGHGVQKTSMLA